MSSATSTAYAWDSETPEHSEEWKGTENLCEKDPKLEIEVERARPLFANVSDDDEGADVVLKTRAFRRAVDFLTDQSRIVYKWQKTFAPVPDIDLGPGGSVDLHWKAPDWELLINIPSDPDREATFYGDTRKSSFQFKGSFDPIAFDHGIALWLMKNQSSQ
jgi:hypothetical protein